jgi:FlaA1/EpsC-like NDP-sugar epimerase
MLGRKQEINLQLQQIIDAFLLLVSFWTAYVIRYFGTKWFGWETVGPFTEFHWMIPVIIPFGLIALELQGFYSTPQQKTVEKSLAQLLQASLWIALLIGYCVVLFELRVPNRAVPLIFGLIAPVALIAREQITILFLKLH